MHCGHVVAILGKSKRVFIQAVMRVNSFYLQYGFKMRFLRVDAGKVENAAASLVILNNNGISVQTAAPECQFQNPVERTVQTIGRGVATMLCDQGLLDNSFWGMALQYFIITMNATPNTLCQQSSPDFVVTGRVPDLMHRCLYPFGQPVVAVKLIQERSPFKFEPHGEFGVVCGTPTTANGASLIYFPARGGFLVSM
jgi:hypothetical protein